MTIFREVVYAQPLGFRPLALDLFVPAEPVALCLYLHGGGWRIGSRADGLEVGPNVPRSPWQQPSFFERVAQLGLAVASAEYRLSGEARFPAQLEDVESAARYLAEHRSDFGISTDARVCWGASAGGHLAALHALTTSLPVSAAVCWYPVTDLVALPADIDDAGGQADRSRESREARLLGATADERPETARAASAVHAVRPGAPPFLLLHGDKDTAVPLRQSHRLAEALRAVGGHAVVEEVPGATHIFPELDDAALQRLVERSARFLLAAATGEKGAAAR
ncbi:alpha/beta hydrolase fold domain-containing protein [Spirillospora sp. CA-255316]